MDRPLVVPGRLQRGAADIRAQGIEHTGSVLIEYATRRLGLVDLRDTDVLDMGCGVRFTQTIINRQIPIKSYTGVDADPGPIEFLQSAVDDDRFLFASWDVHHPIYNPRGLHKLSPSTPLPVVGTFDAIWMFSVVTHLDADETNAMLAILRRAVRPGGALLFSACLRADTTTWREGKPDKPGAVVYYNEQFLREIVSRNGWDISAVYPREPYNLGHLVCRPVL